MTDGDALRAAIIAQPEDDTLRLVYADWLEENGQPTRAAFVRAQVWAAQAEPYSPDSLRHADTARRLLDQNKAEWTKPIRQRLLNYRFGRGFIEYAELNAATFTRDATEVFAAEPVRSLRVARFGGAGPVSLAPVFQAPHLARVARLDLNNLQLSPDEFDALLACPHLGNVTDLCLRQNRVLPPWLTTLLAGLLLPALVGLDLADLTHLGPCLADALPRAEHRHLLRLNLDHVAFSSGDIQRVLGSRCLREVEELRLGWLIGSGREGALTHLDLGWVIPWNRLRLLDLDGQGVGDDGVVEIVKEVTRRREAVPLRWLGLAHNRIAADGVRALVHSDPAKLNLYHLDVSGNPVTLSQRAALTTRFPEAKIV